MSPSQASNDDFPRLIGAKANYGGVSEDESDDSRNDMSDVDVDSKSAKPADVDSDTVDYEESDDELKPPSGSDKDSGDESDTSIKRKDPPEIRSFNRHQVNQKPKLVPKLKLQSLNQRDRRREEAKTKAFLMKTMDNTHVRLVKNLNTSYEIFTFICEKYEGAAFHGDPYFIQNYLMEIKYEEGSDLTAFCLKLENAMKAASEATESVMTEGQKSIYLFHFMPKSMNVRTWLMDLQHLGPNGRMKAGTVLPANFAFKGNSKLDHPYRNTKNRNRGRNGGNNNDKKGKHNSDGGRNGRNDNRDKSRGYDQCKKLGCASDVDDTDSSDNHRKVYRQERHEIGLIAVATTINPPLSLTAQANVEMGTMWTIDSGCTRHVTPEAQWFSDISASGGSICVGGKNQMPIEGVGRVGLDVIDSKGNPKTQTLHGVLYAPKLKFSLLSVPARVKHVFLFNFDRKQCAMQTDQPFNI
ncbi:Hypothetical protein PHPALM_427 [Phytophthora palmivora]|uniref:Retrovirus-related Pol polyprotein from transposon TNT 1-94-like beta-barrel domain-containing protein n=1 Tax=Phytophthora palmivora TaxID=4796 RepID=A0A2P4YUW7_9STRA|nr:Hypothetical protein PHPALM_427 [Phytophthora palmivora]